MGNILGDFVSCEPGRNRLPDKFPALPFQSAGVQPWFDHSQRVSKSGCGAMRRFNRQSTIYPRPPGNVNANSAASQNAEKS